MLKSVWEERNLSRTTAFGVFKLVPRNIRDPTARTYDVTMISSEVTVAGDFELESDIEADIENAALERRLADFRYLDRNVCFGHASLATEGCLDDLVV